MFVSGLVGCGGDDEEPADPKEPTRAAEAPEPASESATTADPEEAIQAYFAAMRAGDAAAVCAKESETFQVFKYGDAEGACLDDAANNQPQPVWADPAVVVSLENALGRASAVLEPNAGSDAQAMMVLVDQDGEWIIESFT